MVWLRVIGIVGPARSWLCADVGSIPVVSRQADGKGARARGRAGALRCPEDAEVGRFMKDEQKKKAQNGAGEKAKEAQNQEERERDKGRELAGRQTTLVWLRLIGIVVVDGSVLSAGVGSIPGAAREADGKGARGRGRAGALRCPGDAEAGRFMKDEQKKKAQNGAGEKAKEAQPGRDR